MNNLQIIETESPTSISIAALVETIHLELEKGKERAIHAMEQEKKTTYWNVGKHIKEHLLEHSDRAEYGKALLTQLAHDLNIGKSTLYLSLKFYESYPQIFHTCGKLAWAHYKELLSVPDAETRNNYEQKVLKENLSVRDLKKILRNDKEINVRQEPPATAQLPITRNKPYIYRLQELQHKIVIDLGFQFFIESLFQDLTKDTIIKVNKKGSEYSCAIMAETKAPHYIYKAYFIEAIDGDTIWVNIDLGFNTWTKQKLRLKGINSQTIETPAGLDAKVYIEAKLKDCQFIAVKTYWRDKFTRYLADIFYDKNEADLYSLTQHGKFLNQGLLDAGLAVKYN
jgi:endonuclease YncB( thermonuclease family)